MTRHPLTEANDKLNEAPPRSRTKRKRTFVTRDYTHSPASTVRGNGFPIPPGADIIGACSCSWSSFLVFMYRFACNTCSVHI